MDHPITAAACTVACCLVGAASAIAAAALVPWLSAARGALPIPSAPEACEAVIRAIPRELPDGCQVSVLGCGFGDLATAISVAFPQCECVGYEFSPLPFWCCQLRKTVAGQLNLSFRKENFFQVDLSRSCVVVCFLSPPMMRLVRRQIESQCRNCTVISSLFEVPGWGQQLDCTFRFSNADPGCVYVYKWGP